MLKSLFTFIILAAISASAFSQRTGVWHIAPYPNTQNYGTGQVKLISASNATDIATITDATDGDFRHEVRVSHDSGSTWNALLTEHVDGIRWWSIHHPLSSTYLVVGDSDQYLGRFDGNDAYKFFGLFYFSNDNGKTWKKTLLDSNTIVYSGYMQTELEGAIIVGYVDNIYNSAANQPQDSLLVTTDGWKTWTSRGLPKGGKACWELEGLGKQSYLTYSRFLGQFYVTTDDGVRWDSRGIINNFGITRVAAITSQHLIAVGGIYKSNAPLLYETFDQAKSWSARFDTASSTSSGFISISFSEDKLHGVAVGKKILRTQDGGITWQFDDLPSGLGPFPALDVYYASASFAVAIMPQDQLLRFDGKITLQAPILHDQEPGPLPLGPTKIAWTPIIGASGYRLQVSGKPLNQNVYDSTVYNTNPLLDTVISDTAFLFRAEVVNFAYYVRVEAVNDTEHSTWNEKAALFYTVSSPGKKLPPQIISPDNGKHFSGPVTLTWTPVDGATSYEVKLWLQYQVPFFDTVVAATSVTVTDLQPTFLYAVTIRAIGEHDTSDWSNGDFIFYIDAAGVSTAEEVGLKAYPNPTQNELHVSYPMLKPNTTIDILDCMGRRLSVPYRKNADEVVFDLHSIPSGKYLLVIEGDNHIVRSISVVH